MRNRIISIGLVGALICLLCSAQAMTRDDMRALYREARTPAEALFAQEPDLDGFSTVGQLSGEAQACALRYVNFIRAVAGLDGVAVSDLYALRAQHAAALLAANDEISHAPENLCGMPQDMYDCARDAASACNLAKLNWMRGQIMADGIEYFVRDDGDGNLSSLPHRRWLLNPDMCETGFGFARAQSGMSYVTMYAVDCAESGAQWEYVAWPSAGAFPVELMRSGLAWSVSLNEEVYDIDASYINAELAMNNESVDLMSCGISRDAYGSGACVIFRPDFDGEYLQNQHWHVRISGLVRRDGTSGDIEYDCDMTSVGVQDVANIELSVTETEMMIGDSVQLRADVIPQYADDLTVTWASDNPSIAAVDENGLVTAAGAGTCVISAFSANGRCDMCSVTVREKGK